MLAFLVAAAVGYAIASGAFPPWDKRVSSGSESASTSSSSESASTAASSASKSDDEAASDGSANQNGDADTSSGQEDAGGGVIDATNGPVSLEGTLVREELSTKQTGMGWSAGVYWLVFDKPATINYSGAFGDETNTMDKLAAFQIEQYLDDADKDLGSVTDPAWDPYVGKRVIVTGTLTNTGNAHTIGYARFTDADVTNSRTSGSSSTTAATGTVCASGSASSFDQQMKAAYAKKIRGMISEYGEPGIEEKPYAHATGLVYAKLLDFGAGYDYLYLGYYDPSYDVDLKYPGGRPESYRVEIWAYTDSGLSKVFSDHASQDGQNDYCSAFLYRLKEGVAYVTNGEYTYGPQYRYYQRLWGVGDEGKFRILHTSLENHAADPPTYFIDDLRVSESEFRSEMAGWPNDVVKAYPTGLGSDRDVNATIATVHDTLSRLES